MDSGNQSRKGREGQIAGRMLIGPHLSVFSTTFRYGLISLLELAAADELLQAGTIAARHQLSQHYLSVVLADLRRLGLVHSQKGKNGGYRLICQPREVNLLFLYHALAGSAATAGSPMAGDGTASDAHQLVDGNSHVADAWLWTISRRWSLELAATSLADLQSWSLSTEDPGCG